MLTMTYCPFSDYIPLLAGKWYLLKQKWKTRISETAALSAKKYDEERKGPRVRKHLQMITHLYNTKIYKATLNRRKNH